MTKLEKLFEQTSEFAKNQFDGDSLMPTFVAEDADGNISIFATPWGSPEEKRLVIDILRHKFKEMGIIAYCMLIEAWTRSFDIDDGIPKGMSVSDYEDKKEVVLIAGADSDGNSMAGSMDIIRESEDSGYLADIVIFKEGGGDMTSLLA